MAAQIPPALKGADIQRFAHRAQQLERVKPIISYWCEYLILQKILATGLHTNDAACQTYAIELMDKLEATKASNASNDAILDDVAAKAYVENFALETFARAEESQRSNRVTRQTADTFQAALTFLDLLGIWGEVDPEIKAKSRFAKYHAVRIAKAIKNGEDPNATNPVVEEPKAPTLQNGEEGEIEAELRDMEHGGTGASVEASTKRVYQPPSVESAPESKQPSPPAPTAPSSLPMQEPDVSPIEDVAESDATARQGSVGGGYFPSLPDDPMPLADAVPDEEMTAATTSTTENPPTSTSASAYPPPPDQVSPTDFYQTSTPAVPPASPPISSLPDNSPTLPKVVPPPVSRPHAPPPPPTPAQKVPLAPPPGGYNTDDESVLAAQKHAKWAISALNFEDVNTAVRELRLALGRLGAS